MAKMTSNIKPNAKYCTTIRNDPIIEYLLNDEYASKKYTNTKSDDSRIIIK